MRFATVLALLIAIVLTSPMVGTTHAAAECTTGKLVEVSVEGVKKVGYVFPGRAAEEIRQLAVKAGGRAGNMSPGMTVIFRNTSMGPAIVSAPANRAVLSRVLGSLGLGVAMLVLTPTNSQAGEWDMNSRAPSLTQSGFQNYIQQFENGDMPGTRNMKYCSVPKKDEKKEEKKEAKKETPATTTPTTTTPTTTTPETPVDGTGPGLCPPENPFSCVLHQDPLDPFQQGGPTGGGSGGPGGYYGYCNAVCGPGGGYAIPAPTWSGGWTCMCNGQTYQQP